MISFDDARTLVFASPEVRESYPEDDFQVADYGWEDDSKFLIVAGTSRDVTGVGSLDDLTIDPPTIYVNKLSGNITVQFGLKSYGNPTAGMSPIGSV